MTIWTNVKMSDAASSDLSRRVAPAKLAFAADLKSSNLAAGTSDKACQEAEIIFGQPAVDDLLASTRVRWVHLTAAGYTRFDRDDLRNHFKSIGAMMTNSSAVYDDPCAQHVLSFMLAHNRRHIQSAADQQAGRSWQYSKLRPAVRTLGGQRVLIVGFGSIGLRLVDLLAPFGVSIQAVRRTPDGNEPVPTYSMTKLNELLPSADHVVNLLPSSKANTHMFDADHFSKMQHGAAFYNVGRGDTVDQQALVSALESGHLAGAYLDVTDPEPLPADHPLWRAPNCLITPHIAGGMQNEAEQIIQHFVDNFSRFNASQPLINRIM